MASAKTIPFVDVQITSELIPRNSSDNIEIKLETRTSAGQHIENGISTNSDCPITQILRQIKPKWNLSECQTEIFTNGISNKIFCIEHAKEKLVFRVFGTGTEQLVDRNTELDNFTRLASVGLAAPVYARFRNGLVCGFLSGQCLTVQTIREPAVAAKISRAMAIMHKIPLYDSKTAANVFSAAAGIETSTFSTKSCQWLNSMPVQFQCVNNQRQFVEYFARMDLAKQFTQMEAALKQINCPMVFSHNDLLIYNILLDQANDTVHFIDYEYAGSNPQLFDIGNHFCEYAGIDNIDYERDGPTDEERKHFLKQYFSCFHGHGEENNKQLVDVKEQEDQQLNQLLWEVRHFEAAAHFFWTLWAIHQAHLSEIQFDYMQYAITRHRQFVRLMAQLDIK